MPSYQYISKIRICSQNSIWAIFYNCITVFLSGYNLHVLFRKRLNDILKVSCSHIFMIQRHVFTGNAMKWAFRDPINHESILAHQMDYCVHTTSNYPKQCWIRWLSEALLGPQRTINWMSKKVRSNFMYRYRDEPDCREQPALNNYVFHYWHNGRFQRPL